MTTTTRKRVLIGAGGIVGLLIVALLALPSLIDLNARKPEITAMVKKVTGRELVLDGPISLSILPTPTVTLSGVKFFNVAGSKNPNMVEVKTVIVKPSLGALLTGNVEVSEVTLVEPKIVLEINAEGKPNWEFTPSVAEARPAAAKPDSPKPVSLGRLTIDNGTLIFSDSKAGLSVVAEKANFSASVRSLDGPYSVAGSATINGAALKLDLSVGAKAADGHAVDLALEAGGKLGFKGKLSELGPNARLTGIASSSSDNLIGFADTLIKMTGQPQPDLPPLLAGKFTFDGAIDASQAAISIRDFKLALGQDNAGGSLSLTLKPALALEGKLAADRLDLDRWLAAMAKPATQAPAAPPPAGATAASAPPAGPSLLASITAKLSFEIGEVIYNKQPVRNIALDLDARRGVVAVPKLTATLPGDLVLQAKSTLSGDPNRPTVAGDFSLVGPKLRETLAWLAVDVPSVPANKLTRISLKGRMSSDGGNVQVSDAVFELDDLKGSGGITVTFSVPLSVVMQVNLDTLDLDSYLAASPADKKPAASAPTTTASRPRGRSLGRPESQDRQADLEQGDDRRHRCRHRAARRHAQAERRESLEPRRRAAGAARHDRQLQRPAAAARHRLQLRGAGHGPRAEARRCHAGRAGRRDGLGRHRGQPRADGAARVRAERRRPEPARDRHAGAARRRAGDAEVGGLQGQPDAERPDPRRFH